jgi:hypothetical protein
MTTSVHNLGPVRAGVARRIITPPFNVELAGLGYYLNRTPKRVRDDLAATALVVTGPRRNSIAFVAIDLCYGNQEFVEDIRSRVAAGTDIAPEAICVNCSHSHNAPVAAHILGVGEINQDYVHFAAQMAADAVVQAWESRQPAKFSVGSAEINGITFNRTRENGPVDSRLALLRVDTLEDKPMAVALNFHSHLTAHLETDLSAVSRDWSGEVTDQLEHALPGVMALYLQGICGDVMLSPEFNSTARRFEPAQVITKAALTAWHDSKALTIDVVGAVTGQIAIPTRRWTRDEINRDREEAQSRLKTGDTKDWLTGFARVIVTYPDRLPRRYEGSVEKTVAAVCRFGVEWTDAVLPDLETRPETLQTEVQALRLGDVWFAAQSAELFTTLGLELRRLWPHQNLFLLGYSNGSIGYLPDAYDVQRKSYAANQSPKFTGQFPFTEHSGKVMVQGLLEVLNSLKALGDNKS